MRRLSWQSRVAHPAWTAEPNAGHKALVALETRGRLHALVTQNIDGLHQRAGNSPNLVIEVVDIEAKINLLLPELDKMMGSGLVTLEKVKVVRYGNDPAAE